MGASEDLAAIALQEEELELLSFDFDVAWEIGLTVRNLAVARRHPVAIEVRRFDQPLFYTALEGSSPDNADWIRRKGNVVARFHRSSYAIGLELKMKNATLAEKYALSPTEYASHGGSFPISIRGAGVLGSVTVSGLPQRDDHELVVEALCSYSGRDYKSLSLGPAGL